MNKPPIIISTKDLSYICDIFNWNFNACKLINSFIENITNQEIKDHLNELYYTHKNICEEVIKMIYLEDNYE